MVIRVRDEIDQRMTRVFLSEKGIEHQKKVLARLQGIDQTMMRGFSEEETEMLLQFLERVRDNILSDR